MASGGILDWLTTPEAQLGLGLLSAGGQGQSLGEGLLGATRGANAYALQQREQQIQEEYRKAQIADLQRKTIADQRKQQVLDTLFGGGAGGGSPQAGTVAPATGPAGIPGAAATSGMAGITPDQLAALKINGIDLTDIWKELQPSVQVQNGYAYDPKRTQPGFLPGVSTTPDGRSVLTQVGPNGLPVVSAPQGAPETYGMYRGIEAGVNSANTPMKRYNPETGREEFVSQADVLGAARGQRPASTPTDGSYSREGGLRGVADIAGIPVDVAKEVAAVDAELKKTLKTDERRVLQEYRDKLVNRPQGQPAPAARGGPMAAGPSAAEAAAQEAERARAVDTAKADVVRDTGEQKKLKSAGEMIAATQRAKELLNAGPTESGVGAMIDKAAAFVGKSTKGADIASRLDIATGVLLNNVPRMEGPQSDGDRLEYKIQAGRAADRTIPVPQRLAAMDEIERIQKKYAGLNGGTSEDQKAADVPPHVAAARAEQERRRKLK